MIEAGDRVMVCMSGGEGFHGLLDILMRLRERAPFPFELIAGQPGPEAARFSRPHPAGLPARAGRAFPYRDAGHLFRRQRASFRKGKTMCSLCSRLRRGILYRVAGELGATKIALGHHRDDILGTFFLNLFYGAQDQGDAAQAGIG